MTAPLRLGVLVSGTGTNLQAINRAVTMGELQALVAIVLSDRQDAAGLEWARAEGIEAVFVDPAQVQDRPAYDRVLLEHMRHARVDLIVLAGFMRIVTEALIGPYRHRIMNIHPALLPAFPGMHAQRQAFERGVKLTGCTVHFVTEAVDQGPIILQAAIQVGEEDTVETLRERILQEEHRMYPRAIQLFAEGRLRVEGRRVRLLA